MKELNTKARSSGRVRVSSVVDLDKDIHGAEIRHTQLSSGRFEAQLQRVFLTNCVVDSGVFNQQICGVGRMPTKAYTFAYTPRSDNGHLNNIPLEQGIRLYQPGDELQGTLPRFYDWVSLCFSQSFLENSLELVGSDPDLLLKGGNGSLIKYVDVSELQGKLSELLSWGQAPGFFAESAPIEEAILRSFVKAIDPATPEKSPCCPRKRNTLQRALEFMRHNNGRCLATSELCLELGYSRRQIEYLFNDAYSMGPAKYHRMLRLGEAHRKLLTGSPNSVTITDIAVEYGFLHLGRFARYYCSCFGEYPNQTLHRQHS